ncbi:MAG: four helix bundle protein [Phycisphaeraceae bacterium]
MTREQMKTRTKTFALRVLKLFIAIKTSEEGRIIGRQWLRAGTSVGANYCSSCRARSRREFIAKLGVVEEEADETAFWLELIGDGGLMTERRIEPLLTEANELVAIVAATKKTAKRNNITNRKSKIRSISWHMNVPNSWRNPGKNSAPNTRAASVAPASCRR